MPENIQRAVEFISKIDIHRQALRVFSLRNANAVELASIVEDLFTKPAVQSRGEQSRESFSPIHSDADGGSGMQENKLPTVTAVADERTNSLIVQAPESFMESIAELISQIDSIGKDEQASFRRASEVSDYYSGQVDIPHTFRFPPGKEPIYWGMLGKYSNENGPVPVVLLAQPRRSSAVLNPDYLLLLNGKIDKSVPMKSFVATGYINLPEDGKYRFEAGRATSIKIDGAGYDLNNYSHPNSAEIELVQGIHKIELSVSNNGGQLPGSYLEITASDGKIDMPTFIFESDTSILQSQVGGHSVYELSGWNAEEALIEGVELFKP